MHLAMITPGAHSHFAFGGITSLDKSERKKAGELGNKTVDLAYGPLKKAWNPEIGLDHVYDTVEEIDNDSLVHMHLNSQGYNDGIILGGPGKYDIDHGTRINGFNIAVAQLIQAKFRPV